ncbi:MAG: hypothetical protein F4197_04885 [Acidimicrobiia bacterium]|nr:hypothetical protein [Acidimicrobiia bacterium]
MAVDGERADAQNSGGSGVALADIQLRDKLIADQESLLNVYRCQYDVDTHIVPGGCTSGKPAQDPATPNPFSGTPTQQDMEIRDQLIVTQEALLNAYRCLYNVDTHVVPGGCVGTKPAQDPTESQTTPTSTSTPTPTPQVDSSHPQVLVSFASASYTAEEGTAARVTVQLDAIPNRTVVVPLTAAFHGGATTADAGLLPPSVTFGPNEATKTIAVDIASDKLSDPGETITLAIGQNLPTGVAQGSPSQTTISIIDFGVPTGSQPVIDVYVFYCAAASRGYNQADLTFETDRMNQVVGGFYSRESSGLSTVRFVPGDVVSPDIDWNNTVLGNERDKLSDPSYEGIRSCFSEATTPGDYQQVLMLVDIAPSLFVGAFAWNGAEFPNWNMGKPFNVAVVPTVERSYGSWHSVCVEEIVGTQRVRDLMSTLTTNVQYTQFNASELLECRFVTYWDHLHLVGHELGHTVYGLGHPPGCSIMGKGYTPSSKCPTISLDLSMQISSILNGFYIDCADRETLGWPVVQEDCSSPPPPVTVVFESRSFAAEEGTTAEVTIKLDTVPFRSLTIPLTFTFQGGATAADVGALPTSVTFGPNDTTKTIKFAVIDDNDDETGEQVQISFGSPLPADVSLGPANLSTVPVSFTDAAPPQVQVSFASTSYTAEEGTYAEITVQLDVVPERTLVIPLGMQLQNGASFSDLIRDRSPNRSPRQVTFAAHETTATLRLPISSDNLTETGETIRVQFGTLPAGVTIGSPSHTIINLTDSSLIPVQVSFGSASYTAAEGTRVKIAVQLDTAPWRRLTIPLVSMGQNGAHGNDYASPPTSITFDPFEFETVKTFEVRIVDDDHRDPGESIRLSFGSTLPDGVTQGTPSHTTVNIDDLDTPAVEVNFGAMTYAATEGTTAQVTVQLDKAPKRTVTVPLTTAFKGGATAADFGTLPTSVTFASDATSATVSFAVTDDGISDPNESIQLSIGTTLPAKFTAGTTNQTTVSITDTGVQQLQVRLFADSSTAAEGTVAHVGVAFSADPDRILVIPFTVTFQGGATEDDIDELALNKDPVTGVLTATFAIGERNKPITFSVLTDSLSESGESVTISIGSSLPEGVTLGTPSQFTITLTDPPEVESAN